MENTVNQLGDKSLYIEEMKGDIYMNAQKTVLSSVEILEGFSNASVSLSTYKNKFGNKIHLERAEVNDLYNWVITDLKQNEAPIAVLAGNAGYGKSVILRDLFDILQQAQIPVLGIKADRLVIHGVDELNKELELGDTVQSIFKALSSTAQKFVLLIDQIDALSQSLSSDRRPLNTYHHLIQSLSHVPNIRVVISCRLYDLDYDPLLQEYKDTKIFTTSLLPIEDVVKVLESLNIQVNPNADKLKEFLRIPLHLQLFSKINNPEKFSETITLQTLYDDIWQKFILQKPSTIQLNTTKVQNLVEEISNQMYNAQQLVAKQKLFEGRYTKELEYFYSEEILTKPERGKIQFIHQSFFDYAYARTFIEKGERISDSLQNQHQGLFIRSRVKQVFTYLRELDSQAYIQELEKILFGDYRFHLKLLLINSLGFYSNPLNEEKNFVKEKLFKVDALFKLFVESVHTLEWFRFLVQEIKIVDYFKTENREYLDVIYGLCWRMINTNTVEVIEFLTEINSISFENKSNFIGNLLPSIPADDISLSLPLFHASKSTWDNHNIYRYLDIATQNQPDFVIQELKQQVIAHLPLTDSIKSEYIPGGHDSSHVYDELYKKHKDKAAIFFIDIIKLITEAAKIPHGNKDKIFDSMGYFLYAPLTRQGHHLHLHEEIYDIVLSYLNELSKIQLDKVKNIILPLLQSDIALVINIPIFIMCKYPEQFKVESFRMLSTECFYTTSTEILNYNIKELLRVSYPLFSQEKQALINKVIMGVALEWEKATFHRAKGVSKYGYTRIGYTAYQLASMIPENLRKKHPEIDKFYNEKFRQYGPSKNEAPQGVVVRSGESTMSKNAYEYMNDAQWKESFKKHVSNHHFDWNIPTKTGHCRAFEEYVSRNPERFTSLISSIIDEEEILPIYTVYGLQGLKKANYSPQKTRELFVTFLKKHFYNKELERESLQYAVWLTDYFIENSAIDQNIIDFLTELVVNYEDEKMLNDDPVQDGINCVRGAASLKLVQCYQFAQYKENIFSALESIAENAAVHTRAAALYQLSYLNHLDAERNQDLFFNLMHDYHPSLLKIPLHELHPLVYFIHADFSKLTDFFTKAITIEDSHATISYALFIAWLYDYEKSKELLDATLNKSQIAKKTVVEAAFKSIENKKFEDKCWEMLYRFLDEDDGELGECYEHGFLRMGKAKYSQRLEAFFDRYVHSSIGKYRDYYFYALLLKLSKNIPRKCIEWALQFERHEKPDIQKRMLRNEPLQVIIQSYNAIREYDKNNPTLEVAMDAFDRMLTVPEYRGRANDVLRKIDT